MCSGAKEGELEIWNHVQVSNPLTSHEHFYSKNYYVANNVHQLVFRSVFLSWSHLNNVALCYRVNHFNIQVETFSWVSLIVDEHAHPVIFNTRCRRRQPLRDFADFAALE